MFSINIIAGAPLSIRVVGYFEYRELHTYLSIMTKLSVLFNVKITDVRMGYPYKRGQWMPNPERYDVFRYCLASTSVLNPLVKKFIFCITLAPELAHKQAELEEYMTGLFPENKLVIHWQRCDFGRDWKKVCDEHLTDPNELVWLACNDDHIFIDSNLGMVASAIEHLKADPDPNAIMYYSHWPEQMRMSYKLGGQLTTDGNFIKYQWENFDGIMILKAGRLNKYWERDYGDAQMFKVDYLGAYHNYICPGTVYAPTKEMVRHYEGYSHVNDQMEQTLANIVPPLFIPPGFFDEQINIRIGYYERDDDCVNFNPSAEKLYNVVQSGTDYRWTEKDIPLCWQDKVKYIMTSQTWDDTELNKARDAAFIASTRVPMKCFSYTFTHENAAPAEWFSKHLLTK